MWLASFPSPPRGVWHLGPLPIRAYAFFIITGILIALVISDRRWVARGGERGLVYDIALWMVPFGLVGGRLYHLATDWRTYWGPGGAGTTAALRIWDGGLGIWGAVALGVVGAWIGCRRNGVPLPAFVDAVAPGVVLAQAIGRLGNYFNQELYGRETTLPWGLEIFYRRDPSGILSEHSLDGVSTGQVFAIVQPTFLYELIWNLLVFAALLYLDRRFVFGHGRLFAAYVALYCVGRFGVELLRDDTATHIAGIRINTFTSTFVFLGAVVYMILAPKGREDPALLRSRFADDETEDEAEEAEELAAVNTGSAVAGAAGDGGADAEPVDAGAVEEPAEEAASEQEVSDEAVAQVGEPVVLEGVAVVAGEVEEPADESAEPGVAEVAEVEPEAEAEVVDGAEVAEAESANEVTAEVETADDSAEETETQEVTAQAEEPAEPEVTEVTEVAGVESEAEAADAVVSEGEAEAEVVDGAEVAEAEPGPEVTPAQEAEAEAADAAEPETTEAADAVAEVAEPDGSEIEPVDAAADDAETAEPEAELLPAEPETAQLEAETEPTEADTEAAMPAESEPAKIDVPSDEASLSSLETAEAQEATGDDERKRFRLRLRRRRP
ncbi:prolipoprotein diacylglyceryl transferase [Mycobacterium vicinigordonae]|uniref:Phosphatidylglycerol--prolipoprotein diacylglyceryl transferase n=2 Tax=Mycobacterium vicinigordonae TaxID=1719132 RepID=A0A7D6I1E6_9MYCO|nr:prolipoprotein diacylglyceryl transferase [Mycobacterium vicinigordonae]